MGKVKTHKASAKRFSVTGTGKVKMNHSHHRHKLGIKDQKRKRHLRTGATIASAKVAANIRAIRLPEPYHGYGIRYKGEVIERKEGKTSGKGKK